MQSNSKTNFIRVSIFLTVTVLIASCGPLTAQNSGTDLTQTAAAVPAVTRTAISTTTPTPQATATRRPTMPPVQATGGNEAVLTAAAQTAVAISTTTPTPQATATRRPTMPPVQATGGNEAVLTAAAQTTVAISTTTPTPQPTATRLSMTSLPATNVTAQPTATDENIIVEMPTLTPPTTATPVVIVDSSRVRVRSGVSGELIGVGTISLYAPRRVEVGTNFLIELELELFERYITPTPAGDITRVPVTPITATPSGFDENGNPLPTPTERIPLAQEQGREFYQRMGATLICPPRGFVGCNAARSIDQSQIIRINAPTTFRWSIASEPDTLPTNSSFEVMLWTSGENLDGELEYVTQWSNAFTIELTSAGAGNDVNVRTIQLWIFGGFVGVILIGIVIGVLVQRGRMPKLDQNGEPETVKIRAAPKPPPRKPKVFLSYRRRPSWSVARSVANSLEARGAEVFLDVDDINEGRFADVLQRAIEECDYFVPILSPETLESKWVVREIAEAMRLGKSIIPLVTDDFSFYGADFPREIEGLSEHNAIKLLPEFYEEAVDRLATRFLGL